MARIAIEMPKLGYDMRRGTVGGWLKELGDKVSRGEPIAEIETDKSTVEMECATAGTLVEIGAADVEITPPLLVDLRGFGRRAARRRVVRAAPRQARACLSRDADETAVALTADSSNMSPVFAWRFRVAAGRRTCPLSQSERPRQLQPGGRRHDPGHGSRASRGAVPIPARLGRAASVRTRPLA